MKGFVRHRFANFLCKPVHMTLPTSSGCLNKKIFLWFLFIPCIGLQILELLRKSKKIYDRNGYGRLSPEDFCRVVCQTLALSREYALEVFDQVDRNQLGYITFENFFAYAQKKAEFAGLFSLSEEEKNIPRNGEVSSNYYSKKID